VRLTLAAAATHPGSLLAAHLPP